MKEPHTYEPPPGECIDDACQKAINLAILNECEVRFDFNGIILTATPDASADTLVKAYGEECTRKHEAYLASPAYKQQQEANRIKEAQRKDRVEQLLQGRPEQMAYSDASKWAQSRAANPDPYGTAVLNFAELWARLIEACMAEGSDLEDCAEECSRLADAEGITGFMYGAAVSVLAAVWVHGHELREWERAR